MFEVYFKGALALIASLSLGGARKTHRQIKRGEVQWVAWKGKHDSVYHQKQHQINSKNTNEN